MEKTRITIELRGGAVAAVYANSQDVDVEVIDFDAGDASRESIERELKSRIDVLTPHEVA